MSTVFLGTSDFAAAVLEQLAGDPRHRPALVVTRPDRPRGRGRQMSAPPVADTARRLGLAVDQPNSVNDPEAIARIAEASPQAIVVCAFGALVKEPLLSSHEVLNVHPSLLPRWRGAAPIERAIMAGDEQTGVSIMQLTAGLDSGPVCLAAPEPIASSDSYGTLAPRLRQLGAELLLRALDQGADGRPLPFLEQEEGLATYAEKIAAADRLLDPTGSAIEAERVVRALHPHIGARAELPDGTLLGVHRAALLAGDGEPTQTGEDAAHGVVAQDGRLLLNCTDGALELLEVQPAGGRAMDAAAYLRGHGPVARR